MPLYIGRRAVQSPTQLLSPDSLPNGEYRGWPRINLGDPINRSLVAYYSLDGQSIWGTSLRDLSGSANHGTIVNSPTTVEGRIGKALLFTNASSQYVDIGSLGNFGSLMANFTIATWIKTTLANAGFLAGDFNNGGTMGLNVALSATNGQASATGKLNLYVRDNAGVVCEYATTNATNFNDGNWHHIAYTFNNAASAPRIRIYVDAVDIPLTVNGTNTGPLSSFANWGFNMTVAARNVRGVIGGYIPATIDEFRIWSRTLAPAEIWRLYTRTGGSLGLLTRPRLSLVATSSGAGTQVDPGLGSVSVAGFAPDVAFEDSLALGLGSVAVAGFAPTVEVDTTVSPAVGGTTVSGQTPTVTAGSSLLLGRGLVGVTGYAPAVTGGNSQAGTATGSGWMTWPGVTRL